MEHSGGSLLLGHMVEMLYVQEAATQSKISKRNILQIEFI